MPRVCSPIACEMSPIVQPSAASFLVLQVCRLERVSAARASVLFFPQPKSAAEGIGVVACARMRRQRFELPDVAAPDHGIVGLQRGDEACHDVGNVTPPFLLAVAFQSGPADVVLIGALLVGQVTELHGLHDALDDHGRSKPGSEAQKEHLAALVAAQGLHGGVVDDLHGTTECRREIEPDPPASQVVWFRNRPPAENRAGIADRHHVIHPIRGELLDSGDHPLGGQRRSGWK